MTDLETTTKELPNKINKIIDDAIDAHFMKRGFKPSAMREAILKALKDNNMFIVQDISK
jgi:hypothetical protein